MAESKRKLTDEELCAECAKSTLAAEELAVRCRSLVRACARPYFLAGAEFDDLLQEGMLGLLHAAAMYDPARGVPFRSFASLCIRRRLIDAVRSAGSAGSRLLSDALPLCAVSQGPLPDTAALHPVEKDPEELLIGREEFLEFRRKLSDALSPFENRILALYLEGLSYAEIARRLGRPVKSVDNAVQRIRRKIARLHNPASTA